MNKRTLNDTIGSNSADIKQLLNDISDRIACNNDLIKLLLISNMLDDSGSFIGANENILFDSIDIELYKQFNDVFEMEQYLIGNIKCLIIKPKCKMKMQEIYESYQFIQQNGVCCIIVNDSFTSYELRRCRELGINHIDKKRHSISINY